MWRSSVARFVRDEEAEGSNPFIPTSKPIGRWVFYYYTNVWGTKCIQFILLKVLRQVNIIPDNQYNVIPENLPLVSLSGI